MEYLLVLISVVLAMVISSLLTKRFAASEKVDKGVEFFYWKLSYRRKFIRTLWTIPIDIAVIIYFHITFQSYLWTCTITIMWGILFLIQAIYNYRKWKNEK